MTDRTASNSDARKRKEERVGTIAGHPVVASGILGEEGSACCEIVFSHSGHQPQVTGGVLRAESLAVLRGYFAKHDKG